MEGNSRSTVALVAGGSLLVASAAYGFFQLGSLSSVAERAGLASGVALGLSATAYGLWTRPSARPTSSAPEAPPAADAAAAAPVPTARAPQPIVTVGARPGCPVVVHVDKGPNLQQYDGLNTPEAIRDAVARELTAAAGVEIPVELRDVKVSDDGTLPEPGCSLIVFHVMPNFERIGLPTERARVLGPRDRMPEFERRFRGRVLWITLDDGRVTQATPARRAEKREAFKHSYRENPIAEGGINLMRSGIGLHTHNRYKEWYRVCFDVDDLRAAIADLAKFQPQSQ